MNIYTKTLSNGLRLQAVEMPGARSVTTMILAKAGSRHEGVELSGISHFLEHLFFKGSPRYPTPKEVSGAVDAFGGHFNAFTGKEYAGYFIKCGTPFLEKSLDVLSDMLIEPLLPSDEIDKERGVILEEMAMYQDAPMYQISWDFERALMGDQPLGRDQIGTRDNILKFSREDIMAYKEGYYQAPNMVVTLAGAVNEKTLDLAAPYFEGLSGEKTKDWPAFDPDLKGRMINVRTKKTEQYHLSFGFPGLREKDPAYPILRVLRVILGGNMSSRMFQRVREEQGLCYSIRTYSEGFADAGLLTTQAGVKLSDLPKALKAIKYEYESVGNQGITDQELTDAQNYLLGSLDLSIEDTESVAQDFAQELLLYGGEEDYDQWKKEILSVTKDQVETLAGELLDTEKQRLAVIGPEIGEDVLIKSIIS